MGLSPKAKRWYKYTLSFRYSCTITTKFIAKKNGYTNKFFKKYKKMRDKIY